MCVMDQTGSMARLYEPMPGCFYIQAHGYWFNGVFYADELVVVNEEVEYFKYDRPIATEYQPWHREAITREGKTREEYLMQIYIDLLNAY